MKQHNGIGGRTRSNEEWLRALRAEGVGRQVAVAELRERIRRTILVHLGSNRTEKATFDEGDVGRVSDAWAQECLRAILQGLDTFRGDSRFTTWAYQVALRVVLGKIGRRCEGESARACSHIREALPAWPLDEAKSPDPEQALRQERVWRILRDLIENDLAPVERFTLVAQTFHGLPADQVAAWLGMNCDGVSAIRHTARFSTH